MRQTLHRLAAISKLIGVVASIRFVFAYISHGVVRIRIKGFPQPLLCRPRDSDPYSLRQIFVDRELELDLPRQPKVIVDAGANVGYTSAYLAVQYPQAKVIAIEPDDGNCRMIRENIKGLANVSLMQAALWGTNQTLEVTNRGKRSWSLRVQSSRSGSVRGIDVPTLMSELKIDHIDLLKIDIEGAETNVFSADASRWLDKIGTIVIETHGELAHQTVLTAVRSMSFERSEHGERLILTNTAVK